MPCQCTKQKDICFAAYHCSGLVSKNKPAELYCDPCQVSPYSVLSPIPTPVKH